ncbi:MAG: hypothetical protein FWD14_04560 [Treponema sp.]|nr:hypothetical protein [Treponema sp.]
MKTKVIAVFLFSIFILFLGCESGPKKIRFDELSLKTFVLNRVYYATLFDESDRNVSEIFSSLPIQDVVTQIAERYGVNVDTNLFFIDDVFQVKSYNLAMRNYFVDYVTEDTQRVSINFNRLDQDRLTVEVRLRIFEEGKLISMSDFTTEVPYLVE